MKQKHGTSPSEPEPNPESMELFNAVKLGIGSKVPMEYFNAVKLGKMGKMF